MAATYSTNSGTPKDQVRLLISDVGGENPGTASNFIFDDNEINSFLTLKNSNVMKAAALALRTIAANQVQVLKVIKFLELQTDGKATAEGLRTLASELEEQADAGVPFEVAHITRDSFNPAGLIERP